MASFEFIGTVKSESAFSVQLSVNHEEIDLRKNGATFTGKRPIEAGEDVDVEFEATGLNGTAWALDLGVTCPKGPSSIFSKSGTIGSSGSAKVEETFKLGDPCAKQH